ncbi:hypothetical protein AJ79_09358 [Helicocarpus griseus UAMH5409]|uniref:Zn(2)-C6 fungal-type domain-containing protein n=1 Tax=Helicocarpus griseus UAMH5409 TaxID=1447875 RepID=A0A2B7WK80_9EURO|nr:hypothetical protein AJ79_09358 [Helicocarpus griseus UAMH5409]
MDQETPQGGIKRKRVSKACDRCRSKKYRCDGVRPTCLACQESGHVCSYDPTAKKRGLPEGYVRGLEKLWALSISNIDGLEETVLELLGSKEVESHRRKRLMALWANEGASERLHEAWKSSELYANVEELLSSPGLPGLGSSCSVEDGGNGESEDSMSDIMPEIQFDELLSCRIGRFLLRSRTRSPDESSFSPGSDEKQTKLCVISQPPETEFRAELPIQTPHLLDMYFTHTHCWFPILAKHNILRASYQYSSSSFRVERSMAGSGDHAALWAILSYTTAQIPPGTKINTTALTRFNNAPEEAKQFYTIARSLIPDEKGKFETGHVQALLLLTLVNMGFGDWTAAWVLCGQATSIATDLDLGTQIKGTERPKHSKEAETILGCFVIDTLLSVRLARRPHMRFDSIQSVKLLEEDGLEEWNPWVDVFLIRKLHEGGNTSPRGPLRSCSTFNRLIELSKVLNMLWDYEGLAPDAAAMVYDSFLKHLKDWELKLPPGCRLSEVTSKLSLGESPSLLPHQTFLLWTHMAILILLSASFSSVNRLFSSTVLLQMMDTTLFLLNMHADNFTQTCIPPLFESSLRIIIDSVRMEDLSQDQDIGSSSPWLESMASGLSRSGGVWPVFNSFIEDVRQNRPPKRSPYPRMRDTTHSIRNTKISSNPPPDQWLDGSTELNCTRHPLQEDAHGQAAGEHENYLTHFFPLLPKITKEDQFGELDNRYGNEPSILSSPQDFDDGWVNLQPPPTAALQTSSVTPGLARARERTRSSVSRTLYMSVADHMETNHQDHHSINSGYTHEPPPPRHECKTPSDPPPAQPPAPNDIDSIFHDLPTPKSTESSNTTAPTNNNHDKPSPPAQQLHIDLANYRSFEDALFNDIEDDAPQTKKGDGREKRNEPSPILRPPSIADIWPPPGFFPE